MASVMHGGRAVLAVNGKTIGLFTSCSYGVNYDVSPIFILGRFGAAATEYTGMDPISIQCSGWRIIDHGPFAASNGNMVPKLQELLTAGEVTIAIYDRQDPTKPIMEAFNCRATGFNTSVSSKSLQDLSVSFIGLTLQDESGEQGEVGATTLPE